MSKQGAVLQKYNNELVKYIEELWSSRHILSQALEKDESDRQHLEKRLQQMHQELDVVVGRIRERTAERRQIDEMLREAEEAFSKIIASSEALLDVLKRDPHVQPHAHEQ